MTLSNTTKTLLSEINDFSGNKLKTSLDLGVLMEVASQKNLREVLNNLAFIAKFVTKSFGIMKRIGTTGQGYDALNNEFTDQIQKANSLIVQLITAVDNGTKQYFEATYLAMDAMAMKNLIDLFHDLSWYKNYFIDRH